MLLEVFQLHFAWQHLLREPNILKKTEPQQERLNFFALQPQKEWKNWEQIAEWHPKKSFLFNVQPGKSCFNCFSTMLPRANAAWPVLERCHRLPNVGGRYRRPPNTRYKDQTTWAKHSQKAPHSPGDCENEIIKAVGEWKILQWKS